LLDVVSVGTTLEHVTTLFARHVLVGANPCHEQALASVLKYVMPSALLQLGVQLGDVAERVLVLLLLNLQDVVLNGGCS
jgi:hypothetical protein